MLLGGSTWSIQFSGEDGGIGRHNGKSVGQAAGLQGVHCGQKTGGYIKHILNSQVIGILGESNAL